MAKAKVSVTPKQAKTVETGPLDVKIVADSKDGIIRYNDYDIPKGQYLYGIKCKDGRYLYAVAPDLLTATHNVGLTLDDIKRGTPIKYNPLDNK